MAKSDPTQPRIVCVARAIATTQSRRTVIDKRIDVLETELSKLNAEDADLAQQQHGFQREMDKLSAPSVVQQ